MLKISVRCEYAVLVIDQRTGPCRKISYLYGARKKKNPSLTTWTSRTALISVSLALNQIPAYTVRPRIQGYASRGVHVYYPTFAPIRPRKDSQADLTLARYLPRWRWFTHPQTVTHPCINSISRAQRRVTVEIDTMPNR